VKVEYNQPIDKQLEPVQSRRVNFENVESDTPATLQQLEYYRSGDYRIKWHPSGLQMLMLTMLAA
jgi:hypothetical protein